MLKTEAVGRMGQFWLGMFVLGHTVKITKVIGLLLEERANR